MTPPSAARRCAAENAPDKLVRRVAAVANKVSETNMEAMVNELEAVYSDFPRSDVTEALAAQLIKSVAGKAGALDSDLVVYAALVDCLRNVMSPDIVGPVVNGVAGEWHRIYAEPGTERQAGNLLALMGYLYNFRIISCTLIYDIVRLMAASISPRQVEHVSKLLKVVSLQLRKDDPEAIKSIVGLFLSRKGALSAEASQEFRVRFLLESMEDLMAPRMRTAQSFVNMAEIPLVKFCANLARKHGRATTSGPLSPCMLDILSGSKWWLPGICAKPSDSQPDAKSTHNPPPPPLASSSSSLLLVTPNAQTEALLTHAKRHGMNTDIRRSIFIVMMTSEDYLDAFERILKLGLKKGQERETVRVLVHCAGQEKTFNRFYALLAERFCNFKHGFKVTFQYTLWDFLRLPTSPNRKTVNMARLFAALAARSALHTKVFHPLLEGVLSALQQSFATELFACMAKELKLVSNPDPELASRMEKLRRDLESLNPTL